MAEIAMNGVEATGSDLTVRLLMAPTALARLTQAEARLVVGLMTPAHFTSGTCFIREGDATDTGFMALVVQGEVVVENIIVSRTAPITTAVLGPGCLVGEMGLIDEGPRSASCTAGSDLYCAVLTRDAFYTLVVREPALAAKLLLGVTSLIAARSRESLQKLKLYASLCQTMQSELDEMQRKTARLAGP
jgi:CRP-like cAMP-binding protein